MRALAVAKRGALALAQCVAGAAVGLLPWALWGDLGVIPAVLIGAGLAGGGIYLGWRNRYVAFVSGLWPVALVTTWFMAFLMWAASGLPD